MDTFLQPVDVPERCFLEEVLYWVAFQRLPVVFHLNGLGDLRDSEDWGTYNVDFIDSTLSEDETARAGIPTDPDWIARVQWENDNLPADRDPGEGSSLKKAWLPHYHRAIVGPVAKITTALMQGSLRAKGRLLPGANVEESRPIVEAHGGTIFDIDLKEIPPTFWNLKGIDFDASAARNGTEYYCHVSCLTEDVISLFPPAGEEVTGAKQIGKSFVLRAETKASLRGRPPYPWEAFHWEVTAMLLAGNLPQKKEAAIQHFQQWFQQTKGIRPSRAAIGEKLTPYYEKFVRAAGQKI